MMAGFLRATLLLLPLASFSLAFLATPNRIPNHVLTTRQPASSRLFMETPQPGSVVTIECCLRPEGEFIPETLIDGICVDDYDKPKSLSFVLGEGNYLPGLHQLVSTMTVGSSAEETLDAGWGERNPALEAWIAFADMPNIDNSQIKEGVQLLLANGLKAIVTEVVADEKFKIDANPPLAGAAYQASVNLLKMEEGPEITEYPHATNSRFQVATIALGCFWGVELEYMREPGVVGSAVGYTQGDKENPTYNEVCSGTTGHTEAVLVKYDPDVVSYDRLVHLAMDRLGENKYLLNQVGNDKGSQYRHGIYYHSDEQKEIAEQIIQSYGEGCKTECLPASKWWPAEDYHQQYLLKGGQSAKKSDKSVIRCYG
ncbi:Peptide methionine sulfoxide reductase MsrA [Seminavis robusta]|uniref:peptide-methionine (S)-S-oxide reductase n=1 Tax=Seminavis robusta TaxID=568900 RepID=A0A9N8HRC3_9STRA|nr:Peptide methionine sulfoxide reductase MsrA [Seminavis robusta]|eukprot:Sro1062_g236950.1 Peptide methionine sulfoxide reductase MsrA (370) ;mRNA; r:16788-18007